MKCCFHQLAHKHKKKVLLNPAPARQIDDKHLAMIHSLVLNETEAEFLTGLPVETDSQIREAAKALLEKGQQNIVRKFCRGSFCDLRDTPGRTAFRTATA